MGKVFEYLIGLDIGNTNMKCVALSTSGDILTVERLASHGFFTEDGSEVDGERLMGLVMQILEKTVYEAEQQYPGGRPLGVSVSAMGCQAVLMDDRKKQIFLPPMGRGKQDGDDAYSLTGYHSSHDTFRLRMIKAYDGRREALAEVSRIMPVSDYIAFRLCGNERVTYNTAGSLALLDIRKKEWWKEFMRSWRLSNEVFPSLVESGEVIGELDSAIRNRLGIRTPAAVVSGGQDYSCAALAYGSYDKDKMLDIVGTYELLVAFSDYPELKMQQCRETEFWDCHIDPKYYAHVWEMQGAYWLEWARGHMFSETGLRIDETAWSSLIKSLDDLTLAPVRSFSPLFIPGITMPGNMGGMQPVSVLRNMIESMNLNVKRMMEEAGVKENPKIVAMGGGARSSFWMANKADILGVPVYAPNIPEASAVGAALLAGIGLRIFDGFSDASRVLGKVSTSVFLPDREREKVWKELYEEQFKPLYRQNFDEKSEGLT